MHYSKLMLALVQCFSILPVMALTLAPARENRLFPFDAYQLVARQGVPPAARLIPGGDMVSGPALALELPRVSRESEFWLKVDVPFDSSCRRLAWWVYSRGASWAELKAAIEETDGSIRLYRVPACGDSPWTRYDWDVQSASSSFAILENTGRTNKERRFRGWVFRCPPFAQGKFIFGRLIMNFDAPETPLRYAWIFRDIDESKTFQMAFSGFRLSGEGCGPEARLPLQFLYNDVKDCSVLEYLIRTVSGRAVDCGRIELSRIGDPARTDVVLPALPPGNYWVTVRRFDRHAAFLGTLDASYLVNHSPVRQLPPECTPDMFDFWPGIAEVEIRFSGAPDASISVPVRSMQTGDKVKTIYYGPDKRKAGESVVDIVAPAQTITFKPPIAIQPSTAWRLELQHIRNGVLLDQRIVPLLVTAPSVPAAVVSGKFSHPLFPLEETETISIENEALKTAFGRHLAANRNGWGMSFYWDEIEPVPGFIQYPVIDRYLAEAVAGKIPVTFTLVTHLDRVPRKLWFEQMLDQNGTNHHYTGSFTRHVDPCGAQTWAAYRRTVRELVSHYNDHPEITGWNFSQGVESFWSDASRNQRVVGYSRAAGQAFAAWLRERGWSLTDLSRASGREIGSWDDLTPPQPVFNGELDLRPLWLEWEDFKQQVPGDLFGKLFATVRGVDDHRVLRQYSGMGVGDLNMVLPVFQKYRAQVCFGGGEAMIHAYLQSLCRQAGVPLAGESSAVPPCPPSQLYSMFFELAYGDTDGGINIMWGRFFDPAAPAGTYLEASAQAAKVAACVREIGPTRLLTANAAIGTGMRSIINRSRSFMWTDWCSLNTYQFMDALSFVVGNNLQTAFVTENSSPEVLRQWPLIVFTESPLLHDAAASRLADYVSSGGILVLMGQTGLYDQNGKPSDRLKKLFNLSVCDGKPVAFGKGQVLWLPQPLKWGKELLPLLAEHGYARPVRVKDTRVKCALRRKIGTDDYYLVLFGKTWTGGNPRSGELGNDPVETSVVVTLPGPSRRLQLENVVTGERLGILSSRELSSGFTIRIKPAEMQIIRLRPVPDKSL